MKLFNFDPNIKIVENDEINLVNLFKVIWGGRWFIILITFLAGVLSALYTYTLTPLYKSEISIYPVLSEKTPAGISRLQGLAASFGYDIGTVETNFNIPDIVNSRRLKMTIINKKWYFEERQDSLTLLDYWNLDQGGIRKFLFGWMSSNNVDPEKKLLKDEANALKIIDDRVRVSESKKSGLITVSFLAEEPKLASDIVNFISDAITQYVQKVQTKRTKDNRKFIEERMAEVSETLAASEEKLKRFREENRSIQNSPELQLQYERLQRDLEVDKQVYITLKQQYEISRIEEVKETPVVNVLDEGREAVERYSPKRKVVIILWMFLSGVITTFLTIIIYRVKS